ncbi:MAG TPA: hypothetical protein VF395_03965 [Polyangiaceae bacterium]
MPLAAPSGYTGTRFFPQRPSTLPCPGMKTVVGSSRFAVACALFVFACSSHKQHPPPLPDYTGARGNAGAEPSSDGGDSLEPVRPAQPQLEGPLTTKNSSERTGTFFLPAGYNTRAFPLLVAFHGSDGAGSDMVSAFHSLAVARRFIIVAPDSRQFEGHFNWQVGDGPGHVTDDYTHTLDCIAEVRAKDGVTIDAARTLTAGFSGGGSSAPYLATNEPLFTAFAVLHGGVIQGGIGSNVIRGWFSTGQDDPARPPALVQQSVDYIEGLGFPDVTYTLYPGGHVLSPPELADVVGWWLRS